MIETIWKQNSSTRKCTKCGKLFSVPVNKAEGSNLKNPCRIGNDKYEKCEKCRKTASAHRSNKKLYDGWMSAAPVLYRGHFKGGIDVTDIGGNKYKCYASNGF